MIDTDHSYRSRLSDSANPALSNACRAAGNPGSDRPFRGFSPGKTTARDLCPTIVIAKLLHLSRQPKVTCETITVDSKKESRRPNPTPQRHLYSVSRRFRHSRRVSRTSRWSAVAGSFGLSASEGQFSRCPVSHQIPVKNKAIQASRRGGMPYLRP